MACEHEEQTKEQLAYLQVQPSDTGGAGNYVPASPTLPCPSCGTCPTCGRRNYPAYPYYLYAPSTYPRWPEFYVTY